MALPQKVVDQLSKSPARTQGVFGQLIMLGTVLFGASLAVYLGLAFGYRPYLVGEISKLDNQIETFAKTVPPEDQARLVQFYSQIVNLKSLLGKHVVFSPVFDWIEENTQVNTYFGIVSINYKNSQISIDAISKTLEDASEQLLAFEKLPEVKSVKMANMSLDPSRSWKFNLNLTVNFKSIVSPPEEKPSDDNSQ